MIILDTCFREEMSNYCKIVKSVSVPPEKLIYALFIVFLVEMKK